jgi:hypothetical protein
MMEDRDWIFTDLVLFFMLIAGALLVILAPMVMLVGSLAKSVEDSVLATTPWLLVIVLFSLALILFWFWFRASLFGGGGLLLLLWESLGNLLG